MDGYDEILDVRTAVKEVLGWSDGTYRAVLKAMKGPKGLSLPVYRTGGVRVKVKPRELADWWTESNRA